MLKHKKKFPAAAYVIKIGDLHRSGEIVASAKKIMRGGRKYDASQNFKTYVLTGEMLWDLLKH